MDFDFSDDQEQLRDAVRKWVDKGYHFERRYKASKAGGFDRAAYTELAELGLCGLYISEDDGGLGMGPVEGMVVMEELGRGIVLEPFAQTLIAGGVLGGYAPQPVKDAWLGQDRQRRGAGRAGPPGAQGALPPGRLRHHCRASRLRAGA
jgi:alkylation response protein AidB-like acyl-CoA dehydrogenase